MPCASGRRSGQVTGGLSGILTSGVARKRDEVRVGRGLVTRAGVPNAEAYGIWKHSAGSLTSGVARNDPVIELSAFIPNLDASPPLPNDKLLPERGAEPWELDAPPSLPRELVLSARGVPDLLLLLKERREAAAKASEGRRAQLARLLRLPSLVSPAFESRGDPSKLRRGQGRGGSGCEHLCMCRG
jgi:hypothetical protein